MMLAQDSVRMSLLAFFRPEISLHSFLSISKSVGRNLGPDPPGLLAYMTWLYET